MGFPGKCPAPLFGPLVPFAWEEAKVKVADISGRPGELRPLSILFIL